MILFLDIDGVLNSDRSVIAGISKPSKSVVEHNKNIIDPIAVGLIEKLLIRFPTLNIVVTSTHRINFLYHPDSIAKTADYLFDLTNSYQIKNRVVGLTDSGPGSRGEQIKRYVDKFNVFKYVIVDDINSMLPEQQPFLIKTDNQVGLSAQNYRDITRILGDQDLALVYL